MVLTTGYLEIIQGTERGYRYSMTYRIFRERGGRTGGGERAMGAHARTHTGMVQHTRTRRQHHNEKQNKTKTKPDRQKEKHAHTSTHTHFSKTIAQTQHPQNFSFLFKEGRRKKTAEITLEQKE